MSPTMPKPDEVAFACLVRSCYHSVLPPLLGATATEGIWTAFACGDPDMKNSINLLAQLQAVSDLADAVNDHLIGAHLSTPIEILVRRIADAGLPDPLPVIPAA